ncbi:hypothetical protein EDD22DRAFT_947657 [Suillus occidentalis]|nr:hypothetical protein EDD22DRAFT_947657 [Suillus occidentalis]
MSIRNFHVPILPTSCSSVCGALQPHHFRSPTSRPSLSIKSAPPSRLPFDIMRGRVPGAQTPPPLDRAVGTANLPRPTILSNVSSMIVEAKSALICKTEDVIERHLHLYNGILELVPSLCDELDTIFTDRLSKIIFAITKGMSDARSAAFSSVKREGLKYSKINLCEALRILSLPAGSVHTTNFTSSIATPEDGMEKLQSGKIKMAVTSWPPALVPSRSESPLPELTEDESNGGCQSSTRAYEAEPYSQKTAQRFLVSSSLRF